MVGIPSKSQGCATCRARKKKVCVFIIILPWELMAVCQCDLQRPFCANCLSTGRLCLGYERYPIFLNRTAAGLEKRTRLDEVRIPIYTRSTTSPTSMTENSSIMQSISNNLSESQRDLVHWFRSEFVFAEAGRKFLPLSAPIFSLASPGPLLDLSMQGLAMTQFGRIRNDFIVYRRGQAHYLRSLQQLREAIGDATQSKMEETLACVIVLCLLEVSSSKSLERYC